MRISARADYAVRAVLELAVRQGDGPVKAEVVATAQAIPYKFLEGSSATCGAAASSTAGAAGAAATLWIALRANVRKILEGVTIADLAADALPEPVQRLAVEPAAWDNP